MTSPSAPKSTPYETKRNAKPETKRIEPKTIRRFVANAPDTYPRYPGRSGNTHGDAKEMSPAIAATNEAKRRLPSKT